MNKEQLYDLFQQILNIKKFEHQLLYNAMQVLQHTAKNTYHYFPIKRSCFLFLENEFAKFCIYFTFP